MQDRSAECYFFIDFDVMCFAFLGNDYIDEDYKPISIEAVRYIVNLPDYEKLPPSTYYLPQEPGAFILPLGCVTPLWRYLDLTIQAYCQHGQIIPRHLFMSLPGVAKIHFDHDIYCTQEDDKYGVIQPPLVMRLGGYWEEDPFFSVSEFFEFHSTIQGAITATFLYFNFERMQHLLICPNRALEDKDSFNKYPERLSEKMAIPWGLRIHTIGYNRYWLSCVSTGFGGPLKDVGFEFNHGKIVTTPYGNSDSPSLKYRPSMLIQESALNLVY